MPQARRVVAPSWLNLRTVMGLLLFSVALFAGRQWIERSQATVMVWAAARDLPQDSVLSPADLRPAEVKLTGDVLEGYVQTGRELSGALITRPFRAGELIAGDWLAEEGMISTGRLMTVPVSSEHAVGGTVRPGDRVDVLATFDAGNPLARTKVVARAAEVVDVVTAGGLVLDEDTVVGITLSVTPEEAIRLVFATRNAEIDIGAVVGNGEGLAGATVRMEDFR